MDLPERGGDSEKGTARDGRARGLEKEGPNGVFIRPCWKAQAVINHLLDAFVLSKLHPGVVEREDRGIARVAMPTALALALQHLSAGPPFVLPTADVGTHFPTGKLEDFVDCHHGRHFCLASRSTARHNDAGPIGSACKRAVQGHGNDQDDAVWSISYRYERSEQGPMDATCLVYSGSNLSLHPPLPSPITV